MSNATKRKAFIKEHPDAEIAANTAKAKAEKVEKEKYTHFNNEFDSIKNVFTSLHESVSDGDIHRYFEVMAELVDADKAIAKAGREASNKTIDRFIVLRDDFNKPVEEVVEEPVEEETPEENKLLTG